MKSKEEVIADIRECAEKLGHTPTYPELKRMKNMTHAAYRRYFGTLATALREAGMQPRGGGHRIEMAQLFEDWATVARKVGRVPSAPDYEVHSRYSLQPLQRRFRVWADVPRRMREYAEDNGLQQQWADVMAMVTEQQRQTPEGRRPYARKADKDPLREPARMLEGRRVYGPPLTPEALAHAPVNEAGVVYLFGMLAARLGFVVTHVQSEFPDCEALREIERGRWQRVRIEFEFYSRNFVAHGHDAEACDLIVCWMHDWADCPASLEVLELRGKVAGIPRV